MFGSRNTSLLVVFAFLMSCCATLSAQGLPKDGPLSDGKISEDELVSILATAQNQLLRLSSHAVDEYQPVLEAPGADDPAAWMLMRDGQTVKRLNLGASAGGVPAEVRLIMYRAALKSIARKGEINAGMILYTGRLNETSDTEVLVLEHEHRLGVSSNQVIPYESEGGQLLWGTPVNQDKPYEWFYDGKSSKSR
ncbi:MAG TPA: hypothetical protein VKY53_00685 [Marinobacter sp.]|nr:hypothetical protein [Marinobacter sp.]